MHFEIFRQGGNALASVLIGGEWRWRLRATNGEIIASGEGYHSRQDCEHAIALVKSTNSMTPVQAI